MSAKTILGRLIRVTTWLLILDFMLLFVFINLAQNLSDRSEKFFDPVFMIIGIAWLPLGIFFLVLIALFLLASSIPPVNKWETNIKNLERNFANETTVALGRANGDRSYVIFTWFRRLFWTLFNASFIYILFLAIVFDWKEEMSFGRHRLTPSEISMLMHSAWALCGILVLLYCLGIGMIFAYSSARTKTSREEGKSFKTCGGVLLFLQPVQFAFALSFRGEIAYDFRNIAVRVAVCVIGVSMLALGIVLQRIGGQRESSTAPDQDLPTQLAN